MPKIEPFVSTRVPNLPDVSPDILSRPAQELAAGGEKLRKVGMQALDVFDTLAKKEQQASDAIEAIKLETTLNDQFGKLAESYNNRMDYANFDENLKTQLDTLHSTVAPKNPSKELNIVFERAFSQKVSHLQNEVRTKKWDVMDQQGRLAFGNVYDQAVNDWAAEQNLTKKELIKKELEIKAATVQINNAVNPIWLQEKLKHFDNDTKKMSIDLADVKADKAIMVNPAQAFIDFHDPKYLPDLQPKQRQDKIEKAIAADKVFRNEQQRELEKNIKAYSDETYAKITQRIRTGENAAIIESDIFSNGPAGNKILLQTDYDKLLSHLDATKKSKGIESDPDTLRDVTIRSNLSVPQISESEITSLMKSGRLSSTDGGKAFDQIRSTNRSLRDESKAKNNKIYDDAEKHIMRGLGVVGGLIGSLTEKLDPMQVELISQATTELWNRSVDRGGKEDPMAVAKEILPVYRGAWGSKLQQSISTLQKVINVNKYPDKSSVVRDFEKGIITGSEFSRKAKAFMDMENQMRQLESIQSEVKPKQEKLR